MSELELTDLILRHALELQNLSLHEEAEADAILRQLADELRQLAASMPEGRGKREVDALIRQAEEAIAARYTEVAASLDTHGLVVLVADRTVDALQSYGIPAQRMTVERVASLAKEVLIDGSPAKAWWDRQAEDTAFRFAAQVRQGVVNGETQERIVQRIVGRRGEPGIMDIARRNARTLVHSSIMSAANQARLATYRKNNAHVAGVRWLATLDSHTCMQCAALDGQAWDLEGQPLKDTKAAFQLPPAHFSCRCIGSPIAKSLDDLLGTTGLDAMIRDGRTRASSEGPISGDTSMSGFLRRNPAAAAEILGKRRVEMFMTGRLTLTDLITKTGRPRTLDELKAR